MARSGVCVAVMPVVAGCDKLLGLQQVRAFAFIVAFALAGVGCDYFLRLDPVKAPPDAPAPPPPSSWSQVATATDHTCGIRIEGTLWCWGRNDQNQLGAGSDPESDAPQVVPSTVWAAVSAFDAHTCGIHTDHTLWCWGNNDDGELGTGNNNPVTGPVQVGKADSTWLAVGTGYRSTCAIDFAGALWCWGDDFKGATGDGMNGGIVGPTPVAPGHTFSEVSVGDVCGCALESTGAVWCWGDNGYGAVGVPNAATPVIAMTVTSSDSFAHVAVGAQNVCAVTTGGRMRCWGTNSDGEVGDDDITAVVTMPTPVDSDQFTDWVDVSVGKTHACGRRMDGSVWCWGSNQHDQLALDSSPYTMRTTPTQVPGGPWTGVAAGDDQTCVFDSNRLLYCAGRAGDGQLGTVGSHTAPVQIAGTWSDLSAGYQNTCAIDATTSTMSCWGANASSTVGDGTTFDRDQPTALAAQTWSGIAIGDDACALDSTNQLYCWGANADGETSFAVGTDTPMPENVKPGATWSNVSTSKHTCAIAAQTLFCWGQNNNAECGAAASATKTLGSGLAGTWLAVAAGSTFTCAIAASGTVIQCFGSDALGELGDNNSMERSSPVNAQVPSVPFDTITSGDSHTCAHTTAGAVYCWGTDQYGQLGDQTTNDEHIPIVLAGTWAEIAAGGNFTCGIKPDMSLWCWGANDHGQLGVGTFTEHHEPQQVGSDSDWKEIRAGEQHACARKTDGSLWCWGLDYDGEIGDGTAWRTKLQVVP